LIIVPPTLDTSRDLLFGLLALQTGLINQAQLVAAFHAWTQARDRSMAETLAERGVLTAACVTLVEGLVIEHLRRHSNDLERSLAAIGVGRSTRECLAQVGDAQLDASLAHVGAGSTEHDSDPDRTATYSVGTTTSDGVRFRVLRPHAHGGLGAIFVALDTELHREVALKQILDSHADDENSRRRFLVEAEITGGLEHPGIVPVYGLGSYADGRPYYAMRFIKGDSLKQAIEHFHADEQLQKDPGRCSLELRKLLRRFTDVCNAIDYAHSRGVLHRDIKPGNIIVGKHGETLVVDWGLAKPLGHVEPGSDVGERTLMPSSASGSAETLPGSTLGTPAYMSPEQACGDLDRLGPRSDVYSLGATLYCLLIGRPPAEGDEIGELLRRIQRGDFPTPRQLDSSIDPALEAVCLRAMATKPENRYPSCRALAEDIERWMADEPVSAWREPLSRQIRRWARRHRPAVTGAAVALLLGLIGLASAAAVYLQQRQVQTSRLELALGEVDLLRGQAEADPEGDPVKWHSALEAARRAEDLLGPLIDTERQRRVRALRQQVSDEAEAAGRDAALVREVRDIRSAEADDLAGVATDVAYARAFRNAGIDVDTLSAREAGAQIKARPAAVALALAAALDDWTNQRTRARPNDGESRRRLLAAARVSDPDETRDRLRQLWSEPGINERRQTLLQLAREADPHGWPPASLTLLAGTLNLAGEREAAVALLGRAQAEHPDDVLVNYVLAQFLEQLHPGSEEAIRYYSVARALRPETAHTLAHALDRRGRGDEAATVFRDLTRRRSQDGRHWCCLGHLLRQRGDRAGAEAALEKAVELLRERIRLDPDDIVARNTLGISLREQGKLAEAIEEIRAVIRLRSNDAWAHYSLGGALAEHGELAEAIAALRAAIQLQPEEAPPHIDLGYALHRQGKLAEAIAEFRTALRLQPDNPTAHNDLAGALIEQGKLAEAIVELGKAIRLKPDYAEAHSNLGTALTRQGRLPEAVAACREAIRLKPDYGEAYTNLGAALSDQGHVDDAIAAFREAIRLKPEFPMAHLNLGLAFQSQGKTPEAAAEYREAIRLNPDYAQAHAELGVVLYGEGRLSEAMTAYRAAIRLKPDYAVAHCNLGLALQNQGKAPEAAAECREAIRLDPDYADAHCVLAHALRQLGEYGESLAEYRRGHELGSKRPGWRYPSDQWVRQAERMVVLETRLPVVLRGDGKPKDAAEALDFGAMVHGRKRYSVAARFYSEAFQADSGLAEDMAAQHRYNAACAAALAGAGQGDDKPPLDEREKARWRKQAIAWLRADLAFWTREAETGKPEARALVSQTLQHWKADSDLAGIRDEAAIKALSDEEQKPCRALWAEVEAVLAKAQAGTGSRPHQ
jgi:tetratricopeptide (TPR) repeat protein/tRNA A-37 threonylcarbamoyl transferase component Bud32